MKRIIKTLCISIAILFFSNSSSFGQTITVSEDSVKTLLCHKWGIERITLLGQDMSTEGHTMTYEFFKDNTYQWVFHNKTEMGTWTYDPENKYIHLKAKKDNLIYIIALKDGEFEKSVNGDKHPIFDPSIEMIEFYKVLNP